MRRTHGGNEPTGHDGRHCKCGRDDDVGLPRYGFWDWRACAEVGTCVTIMLIFAALVASAFTF